MTGKSWERTCFTPLGTNSSDAGASGTCHKKASENHISLPSLKVLSDVVVLAVVTLSVLLVVIS